MLPDLVLGLKTGSVTYLVSFRNNLNLYRGTVRNVATGGNALGHRKGFFHFTLKK